MSVARKSSKNVIVVGSSGGGAATHSTGPEHTLALLRTELNHAGVEIYAMMYVACEKALDFADESTPAALWTVQSGGNIQCTFRGCLRDVNHKCATMRFENLINDMAVDGLVMISSDVDGIHAKIMEAAVARARVGNKSKTQNSFAVVGTGGTSIGKALAMGVPVINGGGSVATNAATRAVSFAAALASHWGQRYVPRGCRGAPSPHSILDGCLPAFLVAYLMQGLLVPFADVLGYKPLGADDEEIRRNIGSMLCKAVTVITCHQVAQLDEIGILGGILVAFFVRNSVLAALIIGYVAGFALLRCYTFAYGRLGSPATGAGIFACSGAVLVSAALGPLIDGPLAAGTDAALNFVEDFLATNPALGTVIGSLLGVLICYGSMFGYYHTVVLPVILVEMAGGNGSLIGTLDEATLAINSLALCAANVIRPRRCLPPATQRNEAKAAAMGLRANFWFGDYIEAAYPFMERDHATHAATYLGCAIAGGITAYRGVRSSAYLPLPLAIWMSNEPGWAALVYGAMFVPPFLTEVVRNSTVLESATEKRQR